MSKRSAGLFRVLYLIESSLVYMEGRYEKRSDRLSEGNRGAYIWRDLKFSAPVDELHIMMTFFMSLQIYYDPIRTNATRLEEYNNTKQSMTMFYIYLHAIWNNSAPNEGQCLGSLHENEVEHFA